MATTQEAPIRPAGRGPGDESAGDAGGGHSASLPSALAEIATRARKALADQTELDRLFNNSVFPMLTVDSERRYLDANRPARLLIRRTRDELRHLSIDDFTPPDGEELLETVWHQLVTTGEVFGSYELRFPDGSRLEIVYWAASYPMRARHLVIFAPAAWSEHELAQSSSAGPNLSIGLTPRELEVLQLAAMGNSARSIATKLVIGESTVKTHLANIYTKLDVSDRAAAVATAIRIVLID